MEVFYQGWGIVQQFIFADAKLPKEVNLPRPADRQVARYLEDRRSFAARDVIDASSPLAQPEPPAAKRKWLRSRVSGERLTSLPDLVLAPSPRLTK
ncbi:MAG: hypothetical protein U0610_14355 [bacterium]